MHLDPINTMDGAAITLWGLHLNLGGGTVAAFVPNRPDLAPLWKSIINFEITSVLKVLLKIKVLTYSTTSSGCILC